MREIRKSGSVGAPGEQSPGATRLVWMRQSGFMPFVVGPAESPNQRTALTRPLPAQKRRGRSPIDGHAFVAKPSFGTSRDEVRLREFRAV